MLLLGHQACAICPKTPAPAARLAPLPCVFMNQPVLGSQGNQHAWTHGMCEQSAADGDLAAQHGSEPKLKHKGIQKLPCQHREGERKGEEMDHHLPAACEPLGRMHAPPGANTLPISRRGTAKLFHMNFLIPLQCLEGFCSSMHTRTHTHTHTRMHTDDLLAPFPVLRRFKVFSVQVY